MATTLLCPVACRARPLTTLRSIPNLPMQPIDLVKACDGRQHAAGLELMAASLAAIRITKAAAGLEQPLRLLVALLPTPFSRMGQRRSLETGLQ